MRIQTTTAAPPARTGFTAPAHHDIEVSLAPEDLGLVDLVRQIRTVEIPQPDGTKRVESEPMPRTEAGLHLGGGLFYDFNGNLSLVPLLAFYAPVESAVAAGGSFTYDPAGWNNSTKVTIQGDKAIVDQPGITNILTVERRGPEVRISRPGLTNDVTVRATPTQVVIDPTGPNNEIHLSRSGSTVSFTAGSGRSGSIEARGHELRITRPGEMFATTVSHQDGRIVIDRPGLGNSVTLTVTPEEITVDPFGLGNATDFRLKGDRVEIDRPGLFNGAEIRKA